MFLFVLLRRLFSFQFDESAFGKVKQSACGKHRGATNPQWAMGVIDGESNEVKIEVVKTRGGDIIADFTRRNVEPGSSAHTDGWAGYNILPRVRSWLPPDGSSSDQDPDDVPLSAWRSMRVTRWMVCHNKAFVADDGTHINPIENAWSVFKRIHGKRYGSRGSLQPFLDEFCFRWSFCEGSIREKGLCFRKLGEVSAAITFMSSPIAVSP